MAGNKIGGLKARDANLKRDPLFYEHIGAIGGKKSRGGGFTGDPIRARAMGKLGGRPRKEI